MAERFALHAYKLQPEDFLQSKLPDANIRRFEVSFEVINRYRVNTPEIFHTNKPDYHQEGSAVAIHVDNSMPEKEFRTMVKAVERIVKPEVALTEIDLNVGSEHLGAMLLQRYLSHKEIAQWATKYANRFQDAAFEITYGDLPRELYTANPFPKHVQVNNLGFDLAPPLVTKNSDTKTSTN